MTPRAPERSVMPPELTVNDRARPSDVVQMWCNV